MELENEVPEPSVDEPVTPAIKVGPILHLLRHAESEHKTHAYALDDDHQQLAKIKDPSLTQRGPLLALTEVSSDVGFLAMPELQTLGDGPNGTGLDAAELGLKYDYDGQVLDQGEAILDGEMAWGDKVVRHVDLRFMKKDWNDENEKDEDGRWCAYRTSWRQNYVKGFVSGLRGANGESAVEIVAVGHGSFFRKLIGEPRDTEWGAAHWRSFCFDENGNLRELAEDEITEMRIE